MHFSKMPTQMVDGVALKDLHTVVLDFFNLMKTAWPQRLWRFTCWAWRR